MKIVIIDYNVGNLQSVTAAFQRAGVEPVISRDPVVIKEADALILPGVGAFPVAMQNLVRFKLVDLLRERVQAGIPILGICLGMQILFALGLEETETAGLNFLAGTVDPIKTTAKLPHMGWNQLQIQQPTHPLVKYLQGGDEMYFVHSYYANCPANEVVASVEYGGVTIPAVVGHGNIMGCQFHPEKSGQIGAQIIKAFKEMVQ